jgi:hypothetical protein
VTRLTTAHAILSVPNTARNVINRPQYNRDQLRHGFPWWGKRSNDPAAATGAAQDHKPNPVIVTLQPLVPVPPIAEKPRSPKRLPAQPQG